jgi:hypothetical protein
MAWMQTADHQDRGSYGTDSENQASEPTGGVSVRFSMSRLSRLGPDVTQPSLDKATVTLKFDN